MVGCLAHRCSISVLRDITDAKKHMTGTTAYFRAPRPLLPNTHTKIHTHHLLTRLHVMCLLPSESVRPLLSLAIQEQLSAPSTSLELTYDLSLAALCADFQENIEFQFSMGWTSLVTRFIGAANAKRALHGADPRLQVRSLG